MEKLKPMAMEQWLRDLPLAPKSKTHVRGIMHLVFKCAERWGIVEWQEPCLPGAREEWKQAAQAATGSHRGRVL